MNNKTLNILSILCLIIVIGVMSWRDMHPKLGAPDAYVFTTYYAGQNITPAMIPDDSMPITIGLGEFSYTPDGKTKWTQQSMPPTTFAQRSVNLQFHFRGLPHNPTDTVQKIKALTDEWVRKGDTVSDIIFDYSPEKPDFKAYSSLLKTAYNELSKPKAGNPPQYTIFASANVLWTDGPQKDALKDLQDNSTQFLFHLPQAHISPELFSKLEVFKYNFVLQFPAGTQPKDINVASIKKLGSLTGITLELDPHKPLPKKEEKIGLFPKL